MHNPGSEGLFVSHFHRKNDYDKKLPENRMLEPSELI